MAKRKFLFLYLTTGAGHISTARVLKEQILKQNPDAEVVMVNGFDKANILGKVGFELLYFWATNFFHGLFPLIYDISQRRFFVTLVSKLMRFHTVHYLKKVFKREQPTDIVSFHFALSPYAKSAVIRLHKKVNITVMVTDPFTVPNAWFWDRSLDYLVYSEEAKQTGIAQKVPAEQITVVPFVMNPKFQEPFDSKDILALRKKHGFDQSKKTVLLVGGGDGLPGAVDIVNKCVLRKARFSIAVVCGKDMGKYAYLESLKRLYPKLDLHVYGFVNYLDELIKLSDCVVMKAGPATLLEALSCRKPIIISRYIHNQELGNMRFAVQNKVGWFIQKPAKIYDKIEEIFEDNDFDSRMAKNFDALKIDADSSKIAKLLLDKGALN
ncbi:MAG: glycosyltransferase [Treponema sp.]|nr:glycosyltransferase [Treponema sp.]MEE3436312.1 glycosyltransferase [Treponema sp.]